jgi:glutathione S-transferase
LETCQHQHPDKLAFGQIPLYEDPDVRLVQSGSIARYLARKHGYNGANEAEAARVDVAYEGANDFLGTLLGYTLGTPDDQKPAALRNLLSNQAPTQFQFFTALLEKNGRNGYLVGDKVPLHMNIMRACVYIYVYGHS